MKKAVFVFVVLFSLFSFGQTQKLKTFRIKQGTEVCKKGNQVTLVDVVSDNRCPQGVQCIQAGEAVVTVFVFKNKKQIRQENINLGFKNKAKYCAFFEETTGYKNIQDVSLKPYPVEGNQTKNKEYYLEVSYLK